MSRFHNIGQRRYKTSLRFRPVIPECTALVDLFFLLLLFVVMASSVVSLSGIKVNLPQVKAPEVSGLGKLIVTLTAPTSEAQTRIFFRDKEVSMAELQKSFAEISDRSQRTVIIRADREVPSGILNEVIAVAEEARLASFLAVQLPDDKPETRFE